MSKLILVKQAAAPSSPAATKAAIYIDNTTIPILKHKDENAVIATHFDDKHHGLTNASLAQQTGFASDTYLTGSSLLLPSGIIRAGTQIKWVFDMTKTAAGTAALAINIRFGINGAVADTSRCALAFAVGTADADTGLFEVIATFRAVGSGTSAVIQGITKCAHHLAATGLISTGASGIGIVKTTGGGFDSTVASSYIGLSVNGGADFAGTNELVQAEIKNFT